MKSTDKQHGRLDRLRPLPVLVMALMISVSATTLVQAQAPAPATGAPAQQSAPPPAAAETQDLFTRAELEKLLAPVALYSDALLAQVLPASAYPIQIVQAQRWLDKNKDAVAKGDFSAVDDQTWDPAVKALLRFPTVIQNMSADLDWTTDLGDAVVNQPQDVADAIQALRMQAQKSGALQTTKEQRVVSQRQDDREVIVIEPADPSVIFVPTYDPVAVFNPAPGVVAGSLLAFGTAVAVGSMWNNNYWNWRTGAIYPPVWPGYPAWRAPYPGWRAGQPVVRPGGDINIGNGNNINIGNNVKPWRPDPGQYRPGLGSKPGIGGARPGTRPGGGNEINVGNRGGNTVNIDRGGNVNVGNRVGNGAGANVGNGVNIGNNVRSPAGGGANRPNVPRPEARPQPAARPTQRPAQATPPKISAPNRSAMSGVPMGGAANQAFANRGAASRGPMGGGGAAMRPGGGGRGGGGGGGGGRGRR